jgi:hypothetical protein
MLQTRPHPVSREEEETEQAGRGQFGDTKRVEHDLFVYDTRRLLKSPETAGNATSLPRGYQLVNQFLPFAVAMGPIQTGSTAHLSQRPLPWRPLV